MLLGRFPGPPSRQDAELSRAVRPTTYQFLAPSPFCALFHKMATLQGPGLYPAPEAYSLCAEVQKTHGIVAPDQLCVQHAKIPSSPEQSPQPAARHFFCAHKKNLLHKMGSPLGPWPWGWDVLGLTSMAARAGWLWTPSKSQKRKKHQGYQALWAISSPSELAP